MVSATSRLVCRNRQWVGQVPKCEIRQNPSGVCARASCEHICNEINGRPVCSCYRGFRLEGRKCVGEYNEIPAAVRGNYRYRARTEAPPSPLFGRGRVSILPDRSSAYRPLLPKGISCFEPLWPPSATSFLQILISTREISATFFIQVSFAFLTRENFFFFGKKRTDISRPLRASLLRILSLHYHIPTSYRLRGCNSRAKATRSSGFTRRAPVISRARHYSARLSTFMTLHRTRRRE